MIKLILLDCDGVLTDGTKTYDRWGNCISKRFCDRDWTAIKRFKAIGVKVVIITGDDWNEQIAKNRNLDIILTRGTGKDKVEFLPDICEKYEVKPEEICFVGDDLFDIGLMRAVGYSFCPEDAPVEVLNTAIALNEKGGNNLVAWLYTILDLENLIPSYENFDEHMKKIYELDKSEKF